MPKGGGRGRETKYQPEFCDKVLEVGEYGGWLCEMAEACGVHRDTLENWAGANPDFFEALTRAKQKAQAWFERRGREGLTEDKFNAPLWQKQMSARHREEYTERKDVNNNITADGALITALASAMGADDTE